MSIPHPGCNVSISNASGNSADITEDSLVTTDLFHNKVHKGDLFFLADYRTGVAANVVTEFAFLVGNDSGEEDSGLHMRYDANVEGGLLIQVYIADSITGGVTVTPRNFNGNADSVINPAGTYTQTMASVCKVAIVGNTFTTVNPVLWDVYCIGGTGTNQSRSLAATSTIEKVYPAGKDILVKMTTLANSNTLSAKFVMYEDGIHARA